MEAHDAPEAPLAYLTAPELLAGLKKAAKTRHAAKVAALASETAASLCTRMETTTDPAMMWAIHQELHRRGIPPILRGPRHQLGTQGDFLDFAADLRWLALVETIEPRHRLARAIFETIPDTPGWWALVKRQYGITGTRNTRGWSIAFGLDATQRRHLRTIQSADTRRLFDDLHGDHFGQLFETLRIEAAAKPDKAGKRTPTEIAARRARLFRTHQLVAGSIRETARAWQALSGETPSLDTIQRHVTKAAPTFQQLRTDWAKLQRE